jgi:hypothetical protein
MRDLSDHIASSSDFCAGQSASRSGFAAILRSARRISSIALFDAFCRFAVISLSNAE